MGCGCNKASEDGQQWQWVAPDGVTHKATSKAEATAQMNSGGGGYIRRTGN